MDSYYSTNISSWSMLGVIGNMLSPSFCIASLSICSFRSNISEFVSWDYDKWNNIEVYSEMHTIFYSIYTLYKKKEKVK